MGVKPITSKATTMTAIYDFLNAVNYDQNPWQGWHYIWRLKVASRVKLFICKVADGKLPTGAYLYNLNIGHASLCHFCGIHSETANHLLWNC